MMLFGDDPMIVTDIQEMRKWWIRAEIVFNMWSVTALFTIAFVTYFTPQILFR